MEDHYELDDEPPNNSKPERIRGFTYASVCLIASSKLS